MIPLLARFWKTAPATAVCVTAAVLLYAAVAVSGAVWFHGMDDARWRLGAVVHLELVREPDVFGLLDLWSGQLWRIPVTAFHHADLLHLLMNGLSLAFLGFLAEPKLGRFWFAGFLLTSAVVSMLPECWLGNSAVGLSGAAYAVFGLLLVLRRRDRTVGYWMTDFIVAAGLVWLVFCVAATNFGLMRIANAAHFTGFVYGWIAGQVWFASADWNRRIESRGSRLNRLLPRLLPGPARAARASFYAAHLLLLPGLYYAAHPQGNGRYHWYLALGEEDRVRRMEHYETALKRDPSLRKPWLYLAEHHAVRGDLQLAWKTMLQGLLHNRSYGEGLDFSKRIWRALGTAPERRQALETLAQIFRDETDAWQERLGIDPHNLGPAEWPAVEDLDFGTAWDAPAEPPVRAGVNGGPHFRDRTAPPVDPQAPDSALEGVLL